MNLKPLISPGLDQGPLGSTKERSCDLCSTTVERCPGFGTFCYCGLFVIACDGCAKKHGWLTRATATAAHEAAHQVLT